MTLCSRRLATGLSPLLLPALILLGWHVATTRHLISPQILPRPTLVYERIVAMIGSGELWQHVAISLLRVATGFGAGSVIGLALGIAMALSPRVRAYLYPTFSVLIYVPILAWLPLLMIFLGLGETLKIVLIAKSVLVPVTIQTFNAVRNIPAGLVEVAKVNRLNATQRLLHIVLPAAFPAIWAGLRYAHGRAWAALVIVELLASSEGLGFLVIEGQQLLQLDLLVGAIFVLILIGVLLDQLLALPERWIGRWRQDGFTRQQS